MRRGFIRNHVSQTEETSRLSGRILINDSLAFIMRGYPSVICKKDEFVADIVFNQIIKTSLAAIYQNERISESPA